MRLSKWQQLESIHCMQLSLNGSSQHLHLQASAANGLRPCWGMWGLRRITANHSTRIGQRSKFGLRCLPIAFGLARRPQAHSGIRETRRELEFEEEVESSSSRSIESSRARLFRADTDRHRLPSTALRGPAAAA